MITHGVQVKENLCIHFPLMPPYSLLYTISMLLIYNVNQFSTFGMLSQPLFDRIGQNIWYVHKYLLLGLIN